MRYLLLPLLLVNVYAMAQRTVFDVHVNGRKSGEIEAIQRVEKDRIFYTLESDIHYKYLFAFSYDYLFTIDSEYTTENQLLKASCYNEVNDEVTAESHTVWNGKEYEVQTMWDHYELDHMPIRFSLLFLYLKEPTGLDQIYSERFGMYLPIKLLGEGHYELQLHDNKRMEFFYKDGRCQEVTMKHSFVNLRFTRRN